MPRVRSRAARGLTDDQRGMLEGGLYSLVGPVDQRLFGLTESERIVELFGSERGMAELWRIFRHQLIADCVDTSGPGTRPAAWWRYDCPGAPRKEPPLAEQLPLLEKWGLIGVHERKRMQVVRRIVHDPDPPSPTRSRDKGRFAPR